MSQVNPDILCLQETKVKDDSFPVEPFEKLGYSVEFYGQKSYNGVAIISKLKQENVKKGFEGCTYSDQDYKIFLDQKRLLMELILEPFCKNNFSFYLISKFFNAKNFLLP